jgi:hypothetical protein
MRIPSAIALALPALIVATGTAQAHITTAGLATPKGTAEVTVNVPHGCTEIDPAFPNDRTKDKHYPPYKVTVDVHPGVTGIKTLLSDFGKAALTRDAMGNVSTITWTRDGADEAGDDVVFKLVFRGTFPDAAFTRAYFPATEFCRRPGLPDLSDPYTALPAPSGAPDAGAPADGGAPAPNAAPSVLILPARATGWNKYTVPVALPDVAPFFRDAQIVWAGTSAYSANTTTMDLIKKEPGTTVLSALPAGAEIWVKY